MCVCVYWIVCRCGGIMGGLANYIKKEIKCLENMISILINNIFRIETERDRKKLPYWLNYNIIKSLFLTFIEMLLKIIEQQNSWSRTKRNSSAKYNI